MIKTKQIQIQQIDNKARTQAEHIAYFNASKNGRIISASDLPIIWKQNDPNQLLMIRTIFKEHILMTATQIQYSAADLSAVITLNAGNNKSRKIKLACVPAYDWVKLPKVASTKEGLALLNATFGISFNAKEMMEFLEGLSSRKRNRIYIWTPDQSQRADDPIRSVCLSNDYFSLSRFDLDFDGHSDDYDGRSLRVLSDSEPKARSNIPSKFSEEDIRDSCETDPTKAIAMMMYNDRHKKR